MDLFLYKLGESHTPRQGIFTTLRVTREGGHWAEGEGGGGKISQRPFFDPCGKSREVGGEYY